MSLSSDIEDIGFAFEKFFFEDPYDDTWTLFKSSKNKDSILHRGFYYNHFRDNKKSTFFKCRRVIDKKECTGSFTLGNYGKYVCKEHQHKPMQPIECEIKIIMNEIDKTIEENPTVSISSIINIIKFMENIPLLGKIMQRVGQYQQFFLFYQVKVLKFTICFLVSLKMLLQKIISNLIQRQFTLILRKVLLKLVSYIFQMLRLLVVIFILQMQFISKWSN